MSPINVDSRYAVMEDKYYRDSLTRPRGLLGVDINDEFLSRYSLLSSKSGYY